MSKNERIVAIEEHFVSPMMAKKFSGHHKLTPFMHSTRRLENLGNPRITERDEGGIDAQVTLADQRSSIVYGGIAVRRERFAGFAALPTPNPEAAADELERTVSEFAFKGAVINGLTNGSFLGDRKFWHIFERADKLDVPFYLHSAIRNETVFKMYSDGYCKYDYPTLMGTGVGLTRENRST